MLGPTAREALAELTADGMLLAAGSGTLGGSDEITLSFSLPGYSAGQRLRLHQPAVLSDIVRLLFLEAHRHLKHLAELTAQAVPAG